MSAEPHPFLAGASPGIANFITSNALLGASAYRDVASQPVVYSHEGYFEPAHLVLLAGKSGAGKTSYAWLLAAALANATPRNVNLLGREVTRLAPDKHLVIIEEENGKRSSAAGIVHACQMLALPEDPTCERIVSFVRSGTRLQDQSDRTEGVFAALWERAAKGLIGALIIDSWATACSFAGADSSKEEHQAAITKVLRRFVEVSGGPVLVICHTRKAGSEALEDLAGSHQRGAGADVVLMFDAQAEDHVVQSTTVTIVKQRDAADDRPPPAVFSIRRDADMRFVLVDGQVPSTSATSDPAHERLFAYLESKGEAMTRQEIRQDLKMNSEVVRDAIDVLFAERRIRTGPPKRGKNNKDASSYESVLNLDRELRRGGFDPTGGGTL